jgi:uncharacterized membrane protein
MLRRVLVVVLLLSSIAAAEAADKAPAVSGIFLTTRYPAMTVRAGQPATLDLDLRNFDRPPVNLALSVPQVAPGWKATILGGGQPVAAAIVAPNASAALQLRLEPPPTAGPGTYRFTVAAAGEATNLRLPIALTIGKELPAKLKLTTDFPALRGSATTAFKFKVTVANDSGRDATINFAADAPAGMRVTFTQAYGTQEITSIPIKAGKSKDIDASVKLPRDTRAGEYKIVMHARSAAAAAEIPLSITVVGRPRLSVTGEGGRLSGEAFAGTQSPLTLLVRNRGSAVARDIRFDATVPDGWKTRFDPKTVPALPPGRVQTVKLLLTPAAKAIAGDYQTTIRANGSQDVSDAADFRITVMTSTLWGAAGIGIIAISLLVVVFAVARFGRR